MDDPVVRDAGIVARDTDPVARDTGVVVLGAGPAGLGAALWAARAGHRVVVIERADHVGGGAASFTVAGQSVDFGSHRLHPSTDPAILAELRALLGEDLQRRPRHGRIRLGERWLAFPLRTADLLRALPPAFALGAAVDAATGWARRPREDRFDEVVRAGVGPTMLRRFYGPYARKIWGVEPAELSGEQARRRIGANAAGALLARVLGARTERPHFFYPRRGFGQIAEALAEAAEKAGAQLLLGHAAESVQVPGRGGDSLVAQGTDPGDGARADNVVVRAGDVVVHASHVWSTLPITMLARLAGAPAEVLGAAERLRFRAMLLVYLVVDTPSYTEFDAHYLPGPETPVTRLSEPKNYRDSGDDPPERTVLCAELPCDMGDEHWTASDAELGELVADGLAAVGLPRPRPIEVAVRRLSHAYPIYHRGYEAAFTTLDEWAASLQPRVLTFGRQGLFAHDNTHHALAMAKAAAESLRPGGGFDEAAWAASRQAFTAHVVED